MPGGVSRYHSVWRYGEAADGPGRHRAHPGHGRRRGPAGARRGVPRRASRCSTTPASLVLDDDGWVAPARRRPAPTCTSSRYGQDYRDAVAAFYAVSGPTPVLPRFALGNWWSRYHRYTADEYLALLDRFAAEGIPFSVARARHGLAPGRHRPGVRQRLDRLHAGTASCSPTRRRSWRGCTTAGLRVTLNVHPADGVRAFEDAYPAMAAALGLDPDAATPIAFDVTDQAFLDGLLRRSCTAALERRRGRLLVDRLAVRAALPGRRHRPAVDAQPLPLPGQRPRRPAAADVLPLRRARAATATRSGSPATPWSPGRRWTSSRTSPRPRRTSATAGGATTSAGTCSAVKDDELATRWVQLGVFSPILRLHSGLNPFNTKEPWPFGAEARAVMTPVPAAAAPARCPTCTR